MADDSQPDQPASGAGVSDGATGDTDSASTGAGEDPSFGPSGYLPARASARARKIVLRSPLGLQWVVGALVAGLAVVVAGVLWWRASGPPETPFVATVAIAEVDGARPLAEVDALLVTGGGPAVAFADRTRFDLRWCPASRRVEGTAGGRPAAWHPGTGRGLGIPSLARHPVVVHDGLAYVDPTRRLEGPRPAPDAEPTACP